MAESISRERAPRATRYRWTVIALLFITYTIAYADRANIGIVMPFMKRDFALSNTEAGLILGLFAISYAAFQIPAAFLVKRLGVRRSIPLFLTLTSIASGAMAFTSSVFALKACRLVLGAVEAPVAVGAMTTVNNWFPAREKGLATGILISASKFAPVLVPPLGAMIILGFGWHYVFILSAVPGFLLAAIWLTTVPDLPSQSMRVNAQETALISDDSLADAASNNQVADTRRDARFRLLDRLIRTRPVPPITTSAGVFRSWNIWGAAMGYFCMAGIVGVILSWLPTYLVEVRKMAILNVGFVSAAPFVGAVIGNIAGGFISDRFFGGRRKPAMMITALATIVTMVLLVNAPSNAVILSALLFVTGVLLSVGYAPYTIYASRMTTKGSFPLALSLTNMGGQTGTAAFPFITGVILDHSGWGTVFAFLAASSLLAFIILCLMIEPMQQVEPA